MPRIRWSGWSVICLVLGMLLTGSPPLALSQAPVLLTAGSRVRLKTVDPSTKWVQGDLVRLSEDSLHIVPAGGADSLAFATGAIDRLEVSRGRRSNAGKGALLGLAIGAGAGLALGVAASAEECSGIGCPEVGPGEVVAVMAFFGATGRAWVPSSGQRRTASAGSRCRGRGSACSSVGPAGTLSWAW